MSVARAHRSRVVVALAIAVVVVVAGVASCIAFLPGAPCHRDNDCRAGHVCDVAHGGYCVATEANDAGTVDAGNGDVDAGGEGEGGEGEGEGGEGEGEGAGEGEGEGEGGLVDAGCANPGAVCGDGIVEACETCDPGAADAGNGACDGCALTTGFFCAGQPSICVPDDAQHHVVIAAGSAQAAVVNAVHANPPAAGDGLIVEVSGTNYDAPTGGDLDGKGTIVIVSTTGATFKATSGADIFHANHATHLVLDGLGVSATSNTILALADGVGTVVDIRGCDFGPTLGIGLQLKGGSVMNVRQTVVHDAHLGNVDDEKGTLLFENSISAHSDGDGILGNTGEIDLTFATVADNGGFGVDCGGTTGLIQASLLANNGGGNQTSCGNIDSSTQDTDNNGADFTRESGAFAAQFRLGPLSVCLDAIAPDGLPPIDFDGAPRPDPGDISDDCGAFERQGP